MLQWNLAIGRVCIEPYFFQILLRLREHLRLDECTQIGHFDAFLLLAAATFRIAGYALGFLCKWESV